MNTDIWSLLPVILILIAICIIDLVLSLLVLRCGLWVWENLRCRRGFLS